MNGNLCLIIVVYDLAMIAASVVDNGILEPAVDPHALVVYAVRKFH